MLEQTDEDRRTPHGVRELKQLGGRNYLRAKWCRTPHGVRELKLSAVVAKISVEQSRTPHGVRELKLLKGVVSLQQLVSHPARGA